MKIGDRIYLIANQLNVGPGAAHSAYLSTSIRKTQKNIFTTEAQRTLR